MAIPNAPTAPTAAADPAHLLEACGEAPGNLCRFVAERTDSVGLAKTADWLARTPLRIFCVVVGAWLLNLLTRRVIRRVSARIEGSEESGRLQRLRERAPGVFLNTGGVNLRAAARAKTVALVLRSIASVIIWGFAFVYVLGAAGLNLGPLLAGAGVAGVALGFGAQSLVRDFLSGLFLLIEDQFGVGDVVDVGDASGVVEQLTLRTTRLRGADGTVWHVPNGQILRVGNMSQQWAMALVEVSVAPNADVEKVSDLLQSAADDVWDRPDARIDVRERPEVLGIEYLGPDAMTIRVQGKTRPGSQWRIGRLLRERFAEVLVEEGIPLPSARYLRPGA